MRTFPGIILIILIASHSLVSTSFGAGEDVMKMVESKAFWSAYKWGSLQESDLFKTGKFNMSASGLDNRYDFYDTDLKFDASEMKFRIKSDNSANSKVDMYFTYLPKATLKEFNDLLQWGTGKFGKKFNDYEKIRKIDAILTNVTREVSWTLKDTVVQLTAVYSVSENPKATTPVKDRITSVSYVVLMFKDRRSVVVNKPAVALKCNAKYRVKSVNVLKFDDINLVLDENGNEVRSFEYTPTDWKLNSDERTFTLDKSDADSNSIHLVITKKNLKLKGEAVVKEFEKTYPLVGRCQKVLPPSP